MNSARGVGFDQRTDALQALYAGTNPAAGLAFALRNGVSCCPMLAGDSTGDNSDGVSPSTEWFGYLGQAIAAKFGCNVMTMAWNDSTQKYDDPITAISAAAGDRYMTVSGAGGWQYAATSVTGDMEIELDAAPTSWAPSGGATIATKWDAAPNRGFYCILEADGRVTFWWSSTGSDLGTFSSSGAVGLSAGQRGQVKINLTAASGAITVQKRAHGGSYSTIGSFAGSGATSIFNNSAIPFQVGSWGVGVQPLQGKIYSVKIRRGAGGPFVAPMLPEMWDRISPDGTVQPGGAHTCLMVNASVGGQGVSYFNDSTRRPKVFCELGQDVIFLSLLHNQLQRTGNAGQGWIAPLDSLIGNVQAALPQRPILPLTQNKTDPARFGTDAAFVRAQRASELLTYAVCKAGVYPMGLYSAFPNLSSQLTSDGLHLTAAGSKAWSDIVFRALLDQSL